MTSAFLSVNGIEAVYDQAILAVRDVSLAVEEGSIVALLGANGAGKTTTLKAISNLLGTERGRISRGTITWRGKPTDRIDPRRISFAAGSCRCWKAATASRSSRSRRTCSPAGSFAACPGAS